MAALVQNENMQSNRNHKNVFLVAPSCALAVFFIKLYLLESRVHVDNENVLTKQERVGLHLGLLLNHCYRAGTHNDNGRISRNFRHLGAICGLNTLFQPNKLYIVGKLSHYPVDSCRNFGKSVDYFRAVCICSRLV
jgi:hypothetical protein